MLPDSGSNCFDWLPITLAEYPFSIFILVQVANLFSKQKVSGILNPYCQAEKARRLSIARGNWNASRVTSLSFSYAYAYSFLSPSWVPLVPEWIHKRSRRLKRKTSRLRRKSRHNLFEDQAVPYCNAELPTVLYKQGRRWKLGFGWRVDMWFVLRIETWCCTFWQCWFHVSHALFVDPTRTDAIKCRFTNTCWSAKRCSFNWSTE